MDSKGASNNERLLAAARSDNEELLLLVFDEGDFDINFQDGLGNTALHYAAQHGYPEILEHLLEYDGCDVDLRNRIEKATPLHLAMTIDELELRVQIVGSLLEAGGDTKIKNKKGQTPADLVAQDDKEIRALFRKAQVQGSIAQSDVADDDDDDDDDSGSGSGSEDD